MEFDFKKNQIIFKNDFEYQMMIQIIKHSGGDFRKVLIRRNTPKKVK